MLFSLPYKVLCKACWKIQIYYGAIEVILINLGGDAIIYTQDLMNFPEEELLTSWIAYVSDVYKL